MSLLAGNLGVHSSSVLSFGRSSRAGGRKYSTGRLRSCGRWRAPKSFSARRCDNPLCGRSQGPCGCVARAGAQHQGDRHPFRRNVRDLRHDPERTQLSAREAQLRRFSLVGAGFKPARKAHREILDRFPPLASRVHASRLLNCPQGPAGDESKCSA